VIKIQILILVVTIFVCACQVSQQAQTNEVSNKFNFNLETIANLSEKRPLEVKKPKAADDSKFSAVMIEKTIQKPKFFINVNVEYPKLKNVKTSSEIKFNQYVKKQVDEQIADFTNFLLDKEKEATSKVRSEYEIELNYQIEYVSDGFISVLMNWRGYTGGMNLDYFPSTINYDLKRGKVIGLSELFEPNSKYLEKLSEVSLEKLKRTCLRCPCKDGTDAGEPLPKGVINDVNEGGMFGLTEAVAAKEENFSGWSIVAEGLKITFHEYQVGPGCIGIIDIVIPFTDLQPILRNDFNFN
jgi:hypothetical protein